MKVFRVEDNEGLGPYQSKLVESLEANEDWYQRMWNHHMDAEHPNPYEDKIKNWDTNYKFGFDSFDALEEWFLGYMDYLEDAGFQIVCYEDVTEYEIGDSCKQLVFIPSDNKYVVSLVD